MKISNTAAGAAAKAIVDLLDAGAGPGKLEIYTGSPPTDVSFAETGTFLGEVTLSSTAFAAPSDSTGTATVAANSITSGTAGAVGTAGWFRAVDSDDNPVVDGTVGQGAGELNLDDNTFEINDTISVSGWSIVMPE